MFFIQFKFFSLTIVSTSASCFIESKLFTNWLFLEYFSSLINNNWFVFSKNDSFWDLSNFLKSKFKSTLSRNNSFKFIFFILSKLTFIFSFFKILFKIVALTISNLTSFHFRLLKTSNFFSTSAKSFSVSII